MKIILNKSAVAKVKKSVFFFKEATKIYIATQDTQELKSLPTKAALLRWIVNNFKIFAHEKEKDSEDRKIQKALENNELENLILNLMIENQFSILEFSRDPFAKIPQIIRDDHRLIYLAPGFYLKPFNKKFDISDIAKKEIIEDYKNHFKDFDKFLEWLISCRFTTNRRSSYTYLRLSAGFGKSFFASILTDLGIGKKVLQTQLKANSAGDLSPMDFRNAFILLIDEFTHFQPELKDMTHGMNISAKYSLNEYVPLYAKVFMSAEKSTSFFGEAGVDAQLADRTNVIDLSHANKLDNNKLYKKNTLIYKAVITEYIHTFVTQKVNEFLKVGEIETNKIASDILDNYYNEHKVEADTIEKIREKCVDYLKDFIEWEKQNEIERGKNFFYEKLEKMVFVKNNDEILVKEPTKLYETLINEAGEQFRKTAKYKQTMLDEIFLIDVSPKSKKSHRDRHGKMQWSFLINLPKMENITKVEIYNKNGTLENEIELKNEILVDKETGKEIF